MNKPLIIILGKSGMLGGYMSDYFESKLHPVSSPSRFDAATIDEQALTEIFKKSAQQDAVIINCIGLIKQRSPHDDELFAVNAQFPHLLANSSKELGIPLIHISTDCVFAGTRGTYNELDLPDAQDSYGISKAHGEPRDATIIRTSFIGSERKNKLSLLEWVKSKKHLDCSGYANHFWNGVTALELAQYCESLIREKRYWNGVRHYYSQKAMSKHDLVRLISNHYNLGIHIKKIDAPIAFDRTLTSIYPHMQTRSIDSQLQELAAWDAKYY